MDTPILDVAVIGAGHAGISISYYLKQLGCKQLVFERNNIGHSWSAQRWDSFKLNTPNKISLLPGMDGNALDPDGFASAQEFVAMLNQYARENELPVQENTPVISVEQSTDDLFSITVEHDGEINQYQSKNVVITSGNQNIKVVPLLASDIPDNIVQLHTAEYRNPESLPAGAVLVVGSAQSGVQIAEDLLEAGRKVFLSTSMVARAPRRYRGRDCMDWMVLLGMMDQRTDEVMDPQVFKMKQPQISGIGPRGKTVSLQALAKKGAVILGRLEKIAGQVVQLQPNAAEHIKFADGFSTQIKEMVDGFIQQAGIDAPPPEIDEADQPDENAATASNETSINLKDQNITSIIWSTGFTGNFSYLKLPVFNGDGSIKHKNGITEIEGLYILGIPWLRKRKSGIIPGIAEDAQFISEQVAATF